jgi:hypothetical protein
LSLHYNSGTNPEKLVSALQRWHPKEGRTSRPFSTINSNNLSSKKPLVEEGRRKTMGCTIGVWNCLAFFVELFDRC